MNILGSKIVRFIAQEVFSLKLSHEKERKMKRNCKAIEVEDAFENGEPGVFNFYGSTNSNSSLIYGMMFICPCGCGILASIAFKNNKDSKGPIWRWDGNKERPTISPSININKGEIGSWHGFLRNGEFKEC